MCTRMSWMLISEEYILLSVSNVSKSNCGVLVKYFHVDVINVIIIITHHGI